MRIIDYPAPSRALDGTEAIAAWQDGSQRSVSAQQLAAFAGVGATDQLREDLLGDGYDHVSGLVGANPTRAIMAARSYAVAGVGVQLGEGGRKGLFIVRLGDYRAQCASDLLQGLYIPFAIDAGAPGATGCLERDWDGAHGYPEWFGAVRNSAAGADMVATANALEACHQLCPTMQLAAADYFVVRKVTFATPYRTIRGCGRTGAAQGQGTRLVLQGTSPVVATSDIIQHGPAVQPADRADFAYEIHLEGFTVVRDGKCTPPASSIKAQYPAGIRSSFVVHSSLRRIASYESSVGFYIGGIVRLNVENCLSQRYQPGNASSGPDYSTGFYLDGSLDIGLAGGNASLYMNLNLVTGAVALSPNPNFVDERGVEGVGAFVDTFLDKMETANTASGIVFAISGATQVGKTVDLHIRYAVVDGVSARGIEINLGPANNATASACIEIIDPYIFARAAGADRGLLVYDGAGSITVTGGQCHGNFAAGSLWLSATRNVRVAGLKIHQATRPVVLASCSVLDLEPQTDVTDLAAGNFAIIATNVTRSRLIPAIISTPANEFLGGVSLDASCSFNMVDGTLIDIAAIGGTAATKVVFNGQDASTGAGLAAFNAAKNVLVGVTG